MTGHFFCIGVPSEIETKEFGSEGKTLLKFQLGKYQRFTTFSETAANVIQNATGTVLVSGEYKEREYNGETYTDAHVTAAMDWKSKPKAKAATPQPQTADDGIPF